MVNILASYVGNIPLAMFAFFAVAFLVHRYYVWNRLSHIPGPFWASISCYWLLRTSLRGNMHRDFKTVNEKYGPLARIGPNELMCSDADTMRRIAGVRSKYTRGGFYEAMKFNPVQDNLLSTRDENVHFELKAKTAAGYSGKEVTNLEPAIDAQVASLILLIERKYLSTTDSHRPLDFARIAQFFTLDVITALAFGDAFGYLESDEDVHGYIQMTEDTIPMLMALAVLPWLVKIMQTRLFRSFIPSENDRLGFGKMMGVAKEVVDRRYTPGAKPQGDMLGSFLAHGLTREEAHSETILQVVAGSDTTATAIRATFLHILSTPRTYSTLRSEIDAAIEHKKISSPITDTEAKALPYLQAVILEGLRIFPPVTGMMSKSVPPGGDIIMGVKVPAGTQIGVCAFGKTHSTATFGPDASVFRPERWLEFGDSAEEKEREKRMRMVVDEIFSSGKWTCPGNSVAKIELNKVFVELLRRFDFALERPTKPWSSHCAGVFIQKDMYVRVTERTS
ncbi:Cytochrome P450 monooxygenase [Lachnellula suecica]|uniref:Cytochrome P450 monooxygenase n=1 Tax=Lachnellula suecica TaxID=602035 RepID=A0A8T9C5L3_9HELO|nr:Cytochrome P450 monooxygenase [Lachnellula suecica]